MTEQFLILFALIFCGYGFGKKNFIPQESIQSLSNIVMFLALPAMVMYRIGRLEMVDDIMIEFFHMVLISFLLIGIGILLSKAYFRMRKVPERFRGVMEFGVIFSNNGFIGFPVALIAFGERGLLLMVSTNFALHTLLFTYGIYIMQQNSQMQKRGRGRDLLLFLRQLSNPNIIAAFLGLFICLNDVVLPEAFWELLLIAGNMATPLSMIFIGVVLTRNRWIDIVKSRKTMEVTLLRLVLMPLISWAALSILPLSPILFQVGVLFMALPAPATLPLVAIQYDNQAELASQIVFSTTLISMATLPIVILLLQ